MLLPDILLARKLARPEDIEKAQLLQRKLGGQLSDHLVILGVVSPEIVEQIGREPPVAPRTVADTGIEPGELLKLLVKMMYTYSLETPSRLSEELKLPYPIVNQLLEDAGQRKLVEPLGAADDGAAAELRYVLTEAGRKWAAEALGQSLYVGPVPVSLGAYQDRILRQRIGGERIDRDTIGKSFSNLIVSEDFIRKIGPGINSGRSILLYGPPGNGKTSVAQKIGTIFHETIYIPYCVEVEGQIIKIFDPSIHEVVEAAAPAKERRALLRDEFDRRWTACQRPVVVTGGELTLEMLDLSFNAHAKFYEAPLHVKALGGTFIIDDFGRQLVSPEAILNRWIVPLESRVDYLKLHTGKSFSLPFDELVIFSTNMAPEDLMDGAFLRRIPYKIETVGPTREEYREIFTRVALKESMELSDEMFAVILEELQQHQPFTLAAYQPGFIVSQIVNACKYQGIAPAFNRELIRDAVANLYPRRDKAAAAVAAAA